MYLLGYAVFLCRLMEKKLSYEAFCSDMLAEVKRKLGEAYSTELAKMPQINGGFRDGIAIRKNGVKMSPTIVTETYYDLYRSEELPFDNIVWEILDTYWNGGEKTEEAAAGLECFDRVKGKIVYRLINRAANSRLLSYIPFFEYLDLAIVFYIRDETNLSGGILIRNGFLAKWGITQEELLAFAKDNTPRLESTQIRPLQEVLKELETQFGTGEYVVPEDGDVPFYILTNSSGLYGAACILYEGVLKDFAERLDSDLLLLPSSLHEFLLLRYEQGDGEPKRLGRLVEYVNATSVQPEDFLSNSVYVYRRQSDRIELVTDNHGLLS